MALPPLPPGFQPRQPGESAYAYKNRVSIARYGKTLYERRMESGAARGLTPKQASGKERVTGEAGASPLSPLTRRERTIAKYGKTPYQLWRSNTIEEMVQEGYTPETTGLSWNQLIQVWPKIRQMNDWASRDDQLTPYMLFDAQQLQREGALEPGWTIANINDRYAAMAEYKNTGGSPFGRARYFRGTSDYLGTVPIAWWWYH